MSAMLQFRKRKLLTTATLRQSKNIFLTNKDVIRLCDDRALSIAELTEEIKKLDKKVMLVGDGAELCFSAMKNEIDNISLAPQNVRFQRASSTAFAAVKAINNGNCVGADILMPKYLRLPQAQRELMAKQKLK